MITDNFFQSFLSYFSCDDGYDPDTNCRKTHCVCKNGGTCDKPGYPCRYKIIKQNENEINHPSLHLPFSSVPRYFYSCEWPIFDVKDLLASVGVQCAKILFLFFCTSPYVHEFMHIL